jgi:hypothetical protein
MVIRTDDFSSRGDPLESRLDIGVEILRDQSLKWRK